MFSSYKFVSLYGKEIFYANKIIKCIRDQIFPNSLNDREKLIRSIDDDIVKGVEHIIVLYKEHIRKKSKYT